MSIWGWLTGHGPDAALERRVQELERLSARRELEWSEWYDKFRRLYARLAKRVERDEQTDRTDGAGTPTTTPRPPSRLRSLRGF